MASLLRKVNTLSPHAKLALGMGAAVATVGAYKFLSTYEACEGCKQRREAMKAAFSKADFSKAPPPPEQPGTQPGVAPH